MNDDQVVPMTDDEVVPVGEEATPELEGGEGAVVAPVEPEEGAGEEMPA